MAAGSGHRQGHISEKSYSRKSHEYSCETSHEIFSNKNFSEIGPKSRKVLESYVKRNF